VGEITSYSVLGSPADDDVLVIVDVSDTSMSPAGTTKQIDLLTVRGYTELQGLQFMTGGGTVISTDISGAVSAGYTGLYLDPRYVWDMSGLTFNGIQNFTIESRMNGSIGWTGNIAYNASGYIKTGTGSPADGIKVYAATPGGSTATQGVIFRRCVFVGSNSRAVIHYGGGQRQCGLVDSLVYNTDASSGAYAVCLDSALSDNNSESGIFSFTGGGGLAGAYGALGIGVYDQTQHANDTQFHDLNTAGGTYAIVKDGGGGHTFLSHYDRSNPSAATIWNHGGGRLIFVGGEDENSTGVSHLVDGSACQTILIGRTVTATSNNTTCEVSAGSLIFRDFAGFNAAQTFAVSGTGAVDMWDPSIAGANVTISGTAGTLVLPSQFAGHGSSPVLTSWSGTITRP